MRDQLLKDAVGECLPLSHVDGVIAGISPDEPLAAQQEIVLRSIRTLLDGGLMVVGHIVGGADERVEPWPLTTEDALARIHDRYVVHHEDQAWSFDTWFALTESGQRTAIARRRRRPGRSRA
ncbi:hypothetical protein [Mycolicibacterium arseniciresistens]|uniref:Methyltransferase n=1 Tax=Mycolicibacterium arseniciresistens TaxID=3062257 RepID=A0ABT8UBZ4_9MYCO|nr:hypothetical protein [Mycolicibacterium arseniciresistens]MDO3634691.1 hypothetical protein [Mycolicibacterium arseniciresistens]